MAPSVSESVASFIDEQLHYYTRQVDDDHDDHGSESTCTGSCLTTWKIVFAAILFVEALIFGHIVIVVRRRTIKSQQRFANIVHFGNAVAAGIFLSTALLHIFPEAIELFAGHSHADEDEHSGTTDTDADDHDDHEGHEHDRSENTTRIVRQDEHDNHSEEEESHSFPWPFFTLLVGFYAFFAFEKLVLPLILPAGASHIEHIDVGDHDHDHARNDTDSPATAADKSEDPDSAPAAPSKYFSRAFIVALVQVFGISVHSLFESMTIGSSKSFSTVLNTFIAVLVHRWATAAAVAFSLASSLTYLQFIAVFLLFSVMCPLGVAIGFATSGMNTTVQGVLFAISASTLLYIGAFELMAEEYIEHKKWLGWKFLGTASGVALMSIITAILVALGIHG